VIRNIVFDFGDVFIDLDKTATPRALQRLGMEEFPLEMTQLFLEYEKGTVKTEAFLDRMQDSLPDAPREEIIEGWNSILLEFPLHRLEFLKELAGRTELRLFLLSNTNELHINDVIRKMGETDFHEFRSCFEGFYLSYELGMRKPDREIFEYVVGERELRPSETLFIDDTPENTLSAESLGMHTWNLRVGKEEVTELHRRFEL